MMLQLLFPMVGHSLYFENSSIGFPKPLVEINGLPMIERSLTAFKELKEPVRFIFVVNEVDCTRFHLDDVLSLLATDCVIIRVPRQTQGALCSALLAVDQLLGEGELVIANYDQILDTDLKNILACFRSEKNDAGVVTFDSVHPKWSFVRQNRDGFACEFAEKRPISRNAIAGFYYFRNASLFFSCAIASIRKGVECDGLYYIAPALNELILENRSIGLYRLEGDGRYWSFYSPAKIDEYQRRCDNGITQN